MKCTLKKELKSILKNSYSQPDLCLWLGSGQLQLPVKLRPAAGGHNVTAAAGQLGTMSQLGIPGPSLVCPGDRSQETLPRLRL